MSKKRTGERIAQRLREEHGVCLTLPLSLYIVMRDRAEAALRRCENHEGGFHWRLYAEGNPVRVVVGSGPPREIGSDEPASLLAKKSTPWDVDLSEVGYLVINDASRQMERPC